MYILASTYLQVEKYLDEALVNKALTAPKIISNKYKIYIELDNDWIKQARKQIKYNALFDILIGKKTKLVVKRKKPLSTQRNLFDEE